MHIKSHLVLGGIWGFVNISIFVYFIKNNMMGDVYFGVIFGVVWFVSILSLYMLIK